MITTFIAIVLAGLLFVLAAGGLAVCFDNKTDGGDLLYLGGVFVGAVLQVLALIFLNLRY